MTILALLLIVLLIVLMRLRVRIRELENRIEQSTLDTPSAAQIAKLSARITALEELKKPASETAAKPEPPTRVAEQVPFTPQHSEPFVERGIPSTATTLAPPITPPPYVPEPLIDVPLASRLKNLLGDDEWETLVGGSLLNKVGAVVLVIGVALFLGFSFAHVTAAGRAFIALSVSLAILGLGIRTERRPRFAVFARGLIGAGWAALYATSYAIYALPEARIIANPFVGSTIMLLVACAMIFHSLRYRRQAITAIAYFAAFAAIAVTPFSPFALASLIPLAASLLYLSQKFDWNAMALFGLAATYATCLSKAGSAAPLAASEAIFLAHWLLFEAFDLLRMQRRSMSERIEFLFPLNALAFTTLSYWTWRHDAPNLLWFAAALGALLFLASATARAYVRREESFAQDAPLLDRLRQGSYEGPFLISVVLAGMSIVGRVSGVWSSSGLAFEAEIVYLAGVRFRSRFLRLTGECGFLFSLAKILTVAVDETKTPIFGHLFWTSTPSLLLHCGVFYFNRAIRRSNVVFSTGAAAIAALVLTVEIPLEWIGTSWFLFGILLLAIGILQRAFDFRAQAYVLILFGALGTAFLQIAGMSTRWQPIAVILAASCLAFVCKRQLLPPFLDRQEEQALAAGQAVLLSLMPVLLLWRLVPPSYLPVAWGALALVLFELGNRRLPSELRLSLAPMTFLTAMATVMTPPGFPMEQKLCVFCGWLFAWAAAARLRFRPMERAAAWETKLLLNLLIALGTVAAVFATASVVAYSYVAVAWITLALGLLEIGSRLQVAPARWIRLQSYAVAALAFFAALLYDIRPSVLLPPIVVVCLFYLAQFSAMRSRDRFMPLAFSLVASSLLSLVLYNRVAGEVLTVAWGLQGLALLGVGFFLRERILRLQGLTLLLVCILKLFLFDLRNLETVYRILSFVALGLILLAVSWIYTRFHDQLKRIL